jgi:hypothetical protein
MTYEVIGKIFEFLVKFLTSVAVLILNAVMELMSIKASEYEEDNLFSG